MKKHAGFMIAALFALFLMLPLSAGAEEAAAIKGMKAAMDKTTKKVSIEGMVVGSSAVNVTLKVLDPGGEIDYVDQTKSAENGKFSFAFTISSSLKGTYTAYVGTERLSEPEKITFEYKDGSPGGGGDNGGVGGGGNGGSGGNGSGAGGNPTAPSDSDLLKLQADGSVKAVIETKLEQDGTTAAGAVGEQDLQKGFAKAKAGQEGKKKAIIELKERKEAKKYALDLPVSYLSAHPEWIIEVRTPKAAAILPGHMLQEMEAKGKNFRFIIAEAKAEGVEKKVKEQIGPRPVIELLAEMDGKAIRWANELAPVTVKIPYSSGVNEESARIGVLDISEQGQAKAVPQAAYNKADQFVQFRTGHTGTYAVINTGMESSTPESKSFEDLGNYPWAQQAIGELAAKGIVKGTSPKTFSPADQVTRADFVLMLVRALDLQADAAGGFADVKPNDYYYEAVGIAKKLGIVTGISGERFEPKAEITRQDMMVMTARALEASGKRIQGKKEDLAGYQDAAKVADYAATSVAGLISQGLIQGSNGLIHPHSHATRAETAVLIYRIFRL